MSLKLTQMGQDIDGGFLRENVAALDVTLAPEDRAELDERIPVGAAAGERYAPAAMRMIDR